jgi:cell division protease FtsH
MFTPKAQQIIDAAKDHAFSRGEAALDIQALLTAIAKVTEGRVLLADCLAISGDRLLVVCAEPSEVAACPGKLPLSEGIRSVIEAANGLAAEVPDYSHPGLIDVRHLVCALAISRDACAVLGVSPKARAEAVTWLTSWNQRGAESPRLDQLTERLREMRAELLARVFGQDHAVHAFVEGLFNAEVVAGADTERRAPRAVFVFAGPPGVGKTFLAELGASHLKRPFKRFDMSAFSGHQQHEQLVGMGRSFHGAHPGTLTEFVEKNPEAVLLFDEIEKASSRTIYLFLQILDAGTLEDKFYERNVSFRDTIIIFTTNAGRSLYDKPNRIGLQAANAQFHRRTILDALEYEKNPETREPFFPAAICSRLATGYPVLFNHLGVNELIRVARTELSRMASLFERQYFKEVSFDDLLPVCLVLREGARVDARTLRSQTETFVKNELFKFCQLFKSDRLDDVFSKIDRIRFRLEGGRSGFNAEVSALFEPPERPKVLIVADAEMASLYEDHIGEVEWRMAESPEDSLEILANEEIDLVLLDIWLGGKTTSGLVTIAGFDHAPIGARSLDQGIELLRRIRERLPEMPVYLLSLPRVQPDGQQRESIDEELLMACVRAGGARGLLSSKFVDSLVGGWREYRDAFAEGLKDTALRLYRERAAGQLGQERKVLTFDTVPFVDPATSEVAIRIRNLRVGRALASADAGEVLEEVERPQVRFDDVIGADGAKEELKFFIDFLRNPRRLAALGLKAPKGVLLHGPPGTGKTMLARAMAGESNVAFIPATGASFVTIWQGSGPQSIRDLFARARRYAPAVVFIDEIDAIGKVRTGTSGAGQAEENTLNALLTEMDGFTSASAARPVFVLAATNFSIESSGSDGSERQARTLDPALVRRFSRTILVDLPDRAARKLYLTKRFSGRQQSSISASTIEVLAEKSAGMSIANLETVIETATRRALERSVEITDELLIEVFDTVHEGEAKEWAPDLLERTARHEAGHTILYWLSGWWPLEVSIVARADRGGGMRRSEDEFRRENKTREERFADIRVSLAGRAAEMLFYGDEAGLSTGAWGDLESATRNAREMICVYGMHAEFGSIAVPELLRSREAVGSPMYSRVCELAGKLLDEQMVRTREVLAGNRRWLECVADALLNKNRLTREELQRMLPEDRQKT